SLVGRGPRTIDVAPGEGSWWRAGAVLGADAYLFRSPRWVALAGAGAMLGALHVRGSGYTVNRSAWNLDLGVDLLLRLQLRTQRGFRPWVGVDAAGWLRHQDLAVIGAGTVAELPSHDLALALGIDFVTN